MFLQTIKQVNIMAGTFNVTLVTQLLHNLTLYMLHAYSSGSSHDSLEHQLPTNLIEGINLDELDIPIPHHEPQVTNNEIPMAQPSQSSPITPTKEHLKPPWGDKLPRIDNCATLKSVYQNMSHSLQLYISDASTLQMVKSTHDLCCNIVCVSETIM